MTKISILLTSYNHADYLRQSIDSILSQTFKDFELIIIDDCSKDNSWNIIKSYRDKRIKKIRNKKNKGSILVPELVRSFNGEYFAVAHCDDYWEKTKLEKQVNYLDTHKNVVACFSYVELIDEDNEVIAHDKNYIDFNVENRDRLEWLNHFFYSGNCLCHPSILLRKSAQLDDNLFVYGLGSFPDFYRWVKLCLKHDIYIYPEKLTYFRIRKGGANTSGYNYNNIVRGAFEEYQLLNLYLNLSDDEFIKTFPDASKYVINKYFNKKYAFAKICIARCKMNYVFYGLNLIYELLQDDNERLNLERYYSYTKKNYIVETGKRDIFSIIDLRKILNSTLFFDIGNNYNEEDSIKINNLLKDDGSFELLFMLNDLKVRGLRIDPSEGRYFCYQDLSIFVNNEKVDFTTNCSLKKDNKYYFFHTDPNLFITFEGNVESVFIKGKSRELSIYEISDYLFEKRLIAIKEDKKLRNKLKKIINKFN